MNDDFLKKKIIPNSFNSEIIKAVKTITYNEKNIIFAGSFIRKSFRDSSDIDLAETFDTDKQTLKGLQEIIKKILANKEYILLDIKSGLNPYFKNAFLNLGYIKNQEIHEFNHEKTINEIHYFKNYIDKDDYNELLKLCQKNISLKNYFDLCEKIRKIITLRWEAKEILQGYKIIHNQPISLISTLSTFIVKIDMAFSFNGFYTEISNVFSNKSALKYGRTFPPITPNPDEYSYCIKYNLLEFLTFNKPLKALKRVYTLALTDDDKKLLHKLYPILISNVAILNKANSIIKTFISIIEKYGNKYNNEIRQQLNNLKVLISNIYEFNFNEMEIDKVFDNKKVSLEVLENVSDKFDNVINKQTNKLIDEYKITIPKKYLL